jgi:hypothetical protein
VKQLRMVFGELAIIFFTKFVLPRLWGNSGADWLIAVLSRTGNIPSDAARATAHDVEIREGNCSQALGQLWQ